MGTVSFASVIVLALKIGIATMSISSVAAGITKLNGKSFFKKSRGVGGVGLDDDFDNEYKSKIRYR